MTDYQRELIDKLKKIANKKGNKPLIELVAALEATMLLLDELEEKE